jgi:hypothetical protein
MTTAVLLFSLIQGITLSGTVWQGAGKPAANAEVQAVGPAGTFQTTSDKDGHFMFRLPKPGTIELRAKLGKSASQASTIFVGQDMDGVGILLPAAASFALIGSLKVDGAAPLPTPRPQIVVHYASGNVANRCDITDAGLFSCPHPAEFTVSLEGLPDSYFVKSINLVSNGCDRTAIIFRRSEAGNLRGMLCSRPDGSLVAVEDLPEPQVVRSIKLEDGDMVKTPIPITSGDLGTSVIITLGFSRLALVSEHTWFRFCQLPFVQ